MNVYDFDGTIYRGDSSLDFYLFCLCRQLSLVRFLPIQIAGFIAYKLGLIGKRRGKELFFSFLKGIPDIHSVVECFWAHYMNHIESWYAERKKEGDVVISASPEFLLAYPCARLRVFLIASIVDTRTGRFLSENCYGEEKVKRFKSVFPEAHVGDFYSDSHSDAPLAGMADKPYRVKHGKIENWDKVYECK